MIKDMKTRISKLNIDFDFEAYWEIIYLILLAFFVGMRFLLSTMFTIYWPKYFYRTLTVIGVVLVLLHLMMAKDISKKEIAAMLVVTFVFMMSHYVSGYDFLVDLLILILGAYGVNFRNILKTYIAVWSVLLVVTIVGAMTGTAENLVYYQGFDGISSFSRVRMALGICYPTDFAAYVAFLMLSYACIRDEYITYTEITIMILIMLAIYYITDARTNFALMFLTVLVCAFLKIFSLKKYFIENRIILRRGGIIFQIIACVGVWILSLIYDSSGLLMNTFDRILSGRLSLGRIALDKYSPKAFGQMIIEHGSGQSIDYSDNYFFIDSSYMSIGLKYGMIMLGLIIFLNCNAISRMIKNEKILWSIMMIIIVIQGMTEHHLIQYWYNPFLVFFFSKLTSGKSKKRAISRSEIMNLN